MIRTILSVCAGAFLLSSCITVTVKEATKKEPSTKEQNTKAPLVAEQKFSSGLNPSAGWARNYGRIKQLYVNAGMIYFKLADGETEMNPKDGFYYVSIHHSNYVGLKDLLFMAAKERYIVKVRTENELDTSGFARVQYIVVDW